EEDSKADDSAKQKEQQSFGQELADEAVLLRSHCLANRDLTASSSGPGGQQICNVDAADEQDQANRTEEKNERETEAAAYALAEGDQTHSPPCFCRILRRILFL